MDALKHVLNVIRLEPKLFYRLNYIESAGLALSINNGAYFHVVEQGQCWLKLADEDPILLSEGDLIVVSNLSHYELRRDLSTEAVDLKAFLELVAGSKDEEADQTVLICGEFRAENDLIYPLFSLLPPLILVRGDEGHAVEWLATSLRFIASEARDDRPGSGTVISRLLDILFIMVIRYWIDQSPIDEGGWLGALYHPQIGEVLGHIHRSPERDWTVETLATEVHMARSTLATQFTTMVGESPIKYLTRWRMQLATVWLMDDVRLTVEEIANRVGYGSSYAFSKAFKRLTGLAPRDYRRKYLGV